MQGFNIKVDDFCFLVALEVALHDLRAFRKIDISNPKIVFNLKNQAGFTGLTE